jgi:hypothetical protein
MDFPDSSDILFSNTFIPTPELNTTVLLDNVEEYRKYYEKQLEIKNENKINKKIRDIELNELDDDANLLNTNPYVTKNDDNNVFKRYQREKVTLVSVDSRDRNKILYPEPNHFKIFLGKTFYNIKKIRLISLEFPNTNAVINNKNNHIYWRNLEDITTDTTINKQGITDYPIYNAIIDIGSYIATSLQSEMTDKMNIVKRLGGTSSKYHVFIITIDQNTDIVKYTSLITKNLNANAFSTVAGDNTITVNLVNHGYTNNQSVYINGVKQVGGIDASVLSGFQIITVKDSNNFTYDVNVQATTSVSGGGGSSASTGIPAPFQLLWGEGYNTVAQNIGFPLENSSQSIFTNITNLKNIFEMTMTFTQNTIFTSSYDFIGKNIQIGYTDSFGNFIDITSVTLIYTIVEVPSSSSIRVMGLSSASDVYIIQNDSNALQVRFSSGTYDERYTILAIKLLESSVFMITTSSNHNYNLTDINLPITLYNTSDPLVPSDTNYDDTYNILQIPSSTQIIVQGIILEDGNGKVGNLNGSFFYCGNIPRHTPLTTSTVKIKDISSFSSIYTLIECFDAHNLKVGDKVRIYNVVTSPQLEEVYTVESTLGINMFVIDFKLTHVISIADSYIGTGLVTVSFPEHGFNNVLYVSNGTSLHTIEIETLLPHSVKVNDIIRFSGFTDDSGLSNITALNRGKCSVTSIINSTTFIIESSDITNPLPTLINIPATITGIMGLHNDFYLYGANDVGGILSTTINSKLFTVREILDVNTFTFMIDGYFAIRTESGGGSNIFISSLHHGYAGIQTNTKYSLLNRSINLEGENYCFMTCPQLNTNNDSILNTGDVTDIFARIVLDQAPGYVNFNFLSNPKVYDTVPLSQLSELEFFIKNYDNTLYNFINLDYSFTLEITEVIDQSSLFNISSRRGIVDVFHNDNRDSKEKNK